MVWWKDDLCSTTEKSAKYNSNPEPYTLAILGMLHNSLVVD